jgi:hypothetical protein
MRLLCGLSLCLALTGCAHEPATAPLTECDKVATELANPQLTKAQTAAVLEEGRKKGCYDQKR